MKKSKAKRIVLICAMAVVLTGCSTGMKETSQVVEPTADVQETDVSTQVALGGLEIDTNSLDTEPTFIDWTQDGSPMQVIALKNALDEVQLAYNTCQVCAGSPYAYFEYQSGLLICQNCGNAFTLDKVGIASGGCNPKPVNGYEIEGDTVVIPEDILAEAVSDFINWKVF